MWCWSVTTTLITLILTLSNSYRKLSSQLLLLVWDQTISCRKGQTSRQWIGWNSIKLNSKEASTRSHLFLYATGPEEVSQISTLDYGEASLSNLHSDIKYSIRAILAMLASSKKSDTNSDHLISQYYLSAHTNLGIFSNLNISIQMRLYVFTSK
jgi:hypothetical protein